jgi:AcrR family transcriptional regulator
LRAAIDVFAKQGFAGARVEKISKAARTTDRMIYYYFGSKERLFVAALETIYKELGDAEAALDLSGLAPDQALCAILRFTWNHYLTHPEMLSLLNNENLQQGRHVSRSKRVKELSFPFVSILSEVWPAAPSKSCFDRTSMLKTSMWPCVPWAISTCRIRYTLSAFLGTNLMAPDALDHWIELTETMILRFVRRVP